MKRNVPIGFRQGEHNDNLKCYIDFKLQGVVVVVFVVVVLYVHVHYVHVWERLCGLGKHLSALSYKFPCSVH